MIKYITLSNSLGNGKCCFNYSNGKYLKNESIRNFDNIECVIPNNFGMSGI